MPTEKTTACPVCGKPSGPTSRPFCSPRCRAIDLGRWLGETYAVPGKPETAEEQDVE